MTIEPLRDVSEQSRLSYAITQLSGAQKSTVGVPAYLRFVNRRLGSYMAALAYSARLSPSQVTALSASCSIAALTLVATLRPTAVVAIGAAALMLLGFALDSADGQLARISGGGSTTGEWLDHVVDTPKTVALHLVILINIFRFQDVGAHSPYLLIPMGFLITSITLYFAMMLRDQLLRAAAPSPIRRDVRSGSVLVSLALLPVDYGTLCLTFVLLPFGDVFRVTYAALFVVSLLFTARALPKAYRTLGAAAMTARFTANGPLVPSDDTNSPFVSDVAPSPGSSRSAP